MQNISSSVYVKLQLRVLEKNAAGGARVIIFTETKKSADNITRMLRQDGWPALAIHGDKTQQERDGVLQEFKAGKTPIMIATDVASRGLDVKEIKFVCRKIVQCMNIRSMILCDTVVSLSLQVINFDMPKEIEDYVHRIGRTGRKTNEG